MKLLGVFAHPDDEVVVGWPLFQDPEIERYVWYASDNRAGYANRSVVACQQFCEAEKITYVGCANEDSEFYRLPIRYKDHVLINAINKILLSLHQAIRMAQPDFIFTHNPIGEYGHGDHRLIFELVANFGRPTLFTDKCSLTHCHLSYGEMPRYVKDAYYRFPYCDPLEVNNPFYTRGIQAYKQYSAWSWSEALPQKPLGVFKLYG